MKKALKSRNAIISLVLIVVLTIMPLGLSKSYAADEDTQTENAEGNDDSDVEKASSDHEESSADEIEDLLDLSFAEIELKPGIDGIILPAHLPGDSEGEIDSEFLDEFLLITINGNVIPLYVEEEERNYEFSVTRRVGESTDDGTIYTVDSLVIKAHTYNHVYGGDKYSETDAFEFDAYTSINEMAGKYQFVVDGVEDRHYTGEAITMDLDVYYVDKFLGETVKLGESLKEGTDYRVEYEDNKEVGTATVTVIGTGKYRGFVEKKFEILPHDHNNPTHVPAKAATCAEDGNREYWICEVCGKVFADANGTTEASLSSFRIAATSHSYDAWEYYNIHQHARTCTYDKSHIEYEDHIWDGGKITREVTATQKGQKTYTCTVCKATKVADVENKLPSDSTRIYGASRYETAFKIAEKVTALNDGGKYKAIIVATGANYPDALTGAYLAKVKNAPIILYKGQETMDFIKENLTPRGRVYILGGTGAVPKSFESDLKDAPDINVTRLGGANRYETNLKILRAAGALGDELIVATGLNFPDALSASAAGKPILLVSGDTLRDDQKSFLRENIFTSITIVGGPGAVSSNMAGELLKYGRVTRVYGDNRYETSEKIARKYFKSTEYVVLAIGSNYPDALTGTPLAFKLNAPMLLASSRGKDCQYAMDYVHFAKATKSIVLGGPTLVSDGAVNAIMK